MKFATHNTNRSSAVRGARRTALTAIMVLQMTATPMHVRAEVPDIDEDGVADAMDTCPDTDPADLAGPDGCTIVSCELGLDGSGWSSRRAYVTYVANWAKEARAAGRLTSRESRSLLRRARKSTCGDRELVRCCVFADFTDDVGQCRIMSEDACEAFDDRLYDRDGEADDDGPGSCLPNPCLF